MPLGKTNLAGSAILMTGAGPSFGFLLLSIACANTAVQKNKAADAIKTLHN
ncbi:hypothetical protein KRR40_18630 [Niabella defluvii]|nr:hypothetical protein KRR40_18630 [Niabella sp. I65]